MASSALEELADLVAVRISLTAANRSAIGMSAVGTSIRANEKALLWLPSVRVLMAIEARSDSTGAPMVSW